MKCRIIIWAFTICKKNNHLENSRIQRVKYSLVEKLKNSIKFSSDEDWILFEISRRILLTS